MGETALLHNTRDLIRREIGFGPMWYSINARSFWAPMPHMPRASDLQRQLAEIESRDPSTCVDGCRLGPGETMVHETIQFPFASRVELDAFRHDEPTAHAPGGVDLDPAGPVDPDEEEEQEE